MTRLSLVPLLALATLLVALPASSQVNTERMRTFQDSAGVSLQVNGGVSFASGNTNYLLAGVGGRIDWVSDSFESFLVGNTTVSEADDVEFSNKAFAHLRLTRELSSLVAVEGFLQAEQNAQRKLTERFLGGAGVRLSFIETETSRFAIGTTPMVEFERLSASTNEADKTLFRLSQYVAAQFTISEYTSFSNIVYVQPDVTNWNDVRLLNDLTFDTLLGKGYTIRIGAHLRYDSQPPETVKDLDFELRNSLVVSL